jgi:hypothetical protein
LDRNRLGTALGDVVIAYPSTDAHLTIMIQLHRAETGAPNTDPRILNLLEALRAETELRDFDGMMQIVPGRASRLDYKILAGWLINKARSLCADKALDDLENYLNAEEIQCETTLALSGVIPEAICELGRGISLVPWDSLRDCSEKQSVWERCVMAEPFHLPEGGLIRRFTIPKRHISYQEFQRDIKAYMGNEDETELYDALMCIALVGPCAPHVVAGWMSLPEWVPKIGGAMTLPALEGFSSVRAYPPDSCGKARELFGAFCELNAGLRTRLRLAMQRLNRAMRRVVPVDASIDLGIALEALFLAAMPDDRGEITFRLKTRAARFLAIDEADRRNVSILVGDLYSMRSSAVHTGAVGSMIRGRPVQEILEEGYSLTADTIRRFITHGEPNWNTVMFG